MADKKISELTVLSAPAAGDMIPIVDISEADDTAKNKYVDPTYFLAATAQAADSAKLGNVAAASYQLIPTWTTFTPTVTWAGGTTDPTSFTSTCKYLQIGKAIFMMVYLNIVKGSGDRTYIKIAPPVACANAASGDCTHTLVTSTFTVGAVYFSSGVFTVNFGTLSRDGYLWLNAFYEAS